MSLPFLQEEGIVQDFFHEIARNSQRNLRRLLHDITQIAGQVYCASGILFGVYASFSFGRLNKQ